MSAPASLAEAGILLRRPDRQGEHRASCPQCDRGPRDDALAVRVDGDGATWLCHRCGWRGAIRDRDPAPARPAPRRREPELERHEVLSPSGWRLWEACRPITADCVAGRYLAGRGCALPEPHAVRWHPELRHPPSGRAWPAMVALVTDAVTGEPITLHRTYLAPDGTGKAPVERERLLLGRHRSAGGVVRLADDAEVTMSLTIAEGLETALFAARAIGPVWSTLCAGTMGDLPVLAGIDVLTITADHDPAGLAAAERCAARWAAAGREVRVWCAPTAGHDIADWGIADADR